MGIFSDYEHSKHEKAYGEGVKNAENADLGDDIMHDLGEIIGTVVPSTSEHDSETQGYNDQKSGGKD